MATLTATIGEILAYQDSIPRDDGRGPKSVRARKPRLKPLKVRDNGLRRAVVHPKPHVSEELLEALNALTAVFKAINKDKGEFKRQKVQDKMREDWSHDLALLAHDLLLLSDAKHSEELEVWLTKGPLQPHLQFDHFLASVPSPTPLGKKASQASWAAPSRGSALIRCSKPATLPLRQ